jgi:putative DNA primase/helicase
MDWSEAMDAGADPRAAAEAANAKAANELASPEPGEQRMSGVTPLPPAYSEVDDSSEDDPVTGDVIRAKVAELAALDEADYLVCKKAAATELDIKPTDLERLVKRARRGDGGKGRNFKIKPPEPWPEPVHGPAMLEALEEALCKYLVLPKYAAPTIALWIIHTHCFEVWDVSPRLAAMAPERGCGKTQVLKMLLRLVCKPYPSASVTAATIYRRVEELQPCLLIDEFDSYGASNEALRNILNAAHEKEFACIDRCNANTNEPESFSAWAPMAIAGIGKLPDTLADRSIIITMQRRKASEIIADLSEDAAKAELLRLQRMAYRWAQDNSDAIRAHKPEKLSWLMNRDADNWKPLLRIADIAGEHVPELAQAACYHFVVERESQDSRAVQLISDMMDMFIGRGDECDRLQSETILESLLRLDERSYNEWTKQGRPISKTTLASALKPHHIFPDTMHFSEMNKSARGYWRGPIEDKYERYVSGGKEDAHPPIPAQGVRPKEPSEKQPFSSTSQGVRRAPQGERPKEILHPENSEKRGPDYGSYGLTSESGVHEETTLDFPEMPEFLRRY